MRVTFYRSLYRIDEINEREAPWTELAEFLSTHVRTADKFSVAGFGCHVLKPPPDGTCIACIQSTKITDAERAVLSTKPHRHLDCVTEVTAFVFDVDVGTVPQIATTEQRLRDASLGAHFYSSHSHTSEKPAFRLLIPTTRPITVREYPALRAHLIERFAIPCNPNQSADASRFWFLPSCPPDGTPIVETLVGDPYDPGTAPKELLLAPERSPLVGWQPPEDPKGAVDIAPLRLAVLKQMERCTALGDHDKAEALRRLINRQALAEDGHRNETTFRVCGTLGFIVPKGTSVGAVMALLRPSLNAMIAAGSKLTEEKVERMVRSAMHKKAQADHTEEVLGNYFRDMKDRKLKESKE